jgi:UDP-2-acetamido-3-amino-2,3-dideoxy-glucuronate N-acetyltransferase
MQLLFGGNTIGAYALIGAAAVITKDVPDYALMVGNPAKQVGWVSANGHKLIFDEKGEATCPESKVVYRLQNNQVQPLN